MFPRQEAERLARQLSEDAPAVLELAVRERAAAAAERGERYVPPQVALASVVLCDDARMRELNLEHRGKDSATDVLTLELRDADVDAGRVRLPVRLLGDAIISLDTAARQARERRGLEAQRQEEQERLARARARAEAGGGKRRRRATAAAGAEDGSKKAGGFGGGGASAAKAKAAAGAKGESSGGGGYSLLDELRVLLVHGALHLVGMDHEAGAREHEAMRAAEARVMAALGWRGSGLISAAEAEAEAEAAEEEGEEGEEPVPEGAGGGGGGAAGKASPGGGGGGPRGPQTTTPRPPPPQSRPAISTTRPRLVALDLDGTLLNAQSRIDPASARVIRAAVEERGVRVVVATGKARPAALAAARAAGLDPALCSERGPGVFLQGLAVHGAQGEALSDSRLPPALVRAALLWGEANGVPLCCFLGDECAALALTPELEELHARYYEPLSVAYGRAQDGGVDALLERAAEVGGTRKLLFTADAARVRERVEPYWRRELALPPPPPAAGAGGGPPPSSSASSSASPFAGAADVTVAVPEMLEVVPRGVNKMAGVRTLLGALGIRADELMAVGDGLNDLEMVAGAGIGVAMGNAVGPVKSAARAVVAAHDAGGIVEAFERFVL